MLIIFAAFALTAPVTVGQWSLAMFGIPLIALSIAEAYAAFNSPQRTRIGAYLPSALPMLAGNLLLLSSALVVNGLLLLLFGVLLIDGVGKLLTAKRRPSAERMPAVVNAIIDFASAALLWLLNHVVGTEQAIGIIVVGFITTAGWRLLMEPAEAAMSAMNPESPTNHPDPGLGLLPNEAFARLRSETDSAAATVRAADFMWMLTLGGVFLAIHVGRMPLSDTVLGIVSPFVATAGDVLMTLVFATFVVLPWRLLWRRFTRPTERAAWSLKLRTGTENIRLHPAANWIITNWLARHTGSASG